MSCMKVVIGTVMLVGSLIAADAGIGTWKLNPAKSKFSSAQHIQSATMTYEPAGNGVKRSGDTVNADGTKISWGYTAEYDGKDYPVTGSPTADTIALQQVNDRTVEATIKKGDKVVAHARRVVSADGKTMTLTIDGTNAQGEKMHSVQVYDKQ